MSGPTPASLAAQAHALADRLRALPESRWTRVDGTGRTVAERGLAIAQLLVDLAAHPDGPARTVPDLGPFAVPDQIAVTATDLAMAGDGVDPEALQAAEAELTALAALVPTPMTPPP